MNQVLITSIHQIANHIYKQKGYLISIDREAVEVVIDAMMLLHNKLENGNGAEATNQTKGM